MTAYERIKQLAVGESESDTLILFGDTVKASKDDKYKLDRGYLVLFSTAQDPDLSGEFFTAKTVFGDHTESPIYYSHGMDATLGKSIVGQATFGIDAKGVWIEGQLDKANEYADDIAELAGQGKLGWSSGTAGHLVEKKAVKDKKGALLATQITRWPLGLDASLTPSPCEPRTRPDIMPAKSLTGPSFKELTEGESSLVDPSSAETDTGLGDYTYSVNPMVGHTLASKVATEHGAVAHALYRNRTLSTAEYGACMKRFCGANSTFHSGLNDDVANREIDRWDDDYAHWKASPGMKTVGDALHAAMTRAYNAGADHMLTCGHVTSGEHAEMRAHFEKCRDGYLEGLGEGVRDRVLKDNGTQYLYLKTISGEGAPDALKVADEASALLADADACAGRAARFHDRLTALKTTRRNSDRDLGPKAIAHIDDATAGLLSLVDALKGLIPLDIDAAKVEGAKAFLAGLS